MSNGSNGDGWKDVLEYWFSPGAEKRWFGGGETVDNEIRSKFGTMVRIISKLISISVFPSSMQSHIFSCCVMRQSSPYSFANI